MKLIFYLANCGFGSEIILLLKIMSFCEINKIDLIISSQNWNCKYKKGWNDYFLPFFEDEYIKKPIYIKKTYLDNFPIFYSNEKLIKINNNEINEIYRFTKWWEIIINKWSCDDLFSKMVTNINKIWKFNKFTYNLIQKRIKILNLQNYDTFHIRRGDKVNSKKGFEEKEANICEYKLYKKYQKSKNVYIMTDDKSVLDNDKNAVSLCYKNGGHCQREFNSNDKILKYVDILILLTEIEIARRANIFVGTLSSNLTKLIYLLRNNYNCYSVDLKEWKVIN